MIIIALTEVIRYITMNAPLGGKKTSKILLATLYIIFILIDINVAQKNVNIEYFNSMYEFFALTFCTSVTKNLFLMWISRKNGILPCLIYKAIFELYVFVIPYVPNINMLIQSVMFMLLPFVLYIIIDGLRSEREVPKAKEVVKRKLEFVESVILLVFFAILAGLVSREFKYSMIAVGSGSMTGTLNKGDAIIYKRYNGEILHEGDVIVFKIDGRLIVHRINKRLFYGDEYAFITKGDANDAEDNWIVESNMVVGRVVQRVQYIAWPSVWISEYY
jgi:signal peptidase